MSVAFDTAYDEDKTYEDGKQYADDKKLLVRFDTRAVKHEFESNKQGRPIFVDQEYITIMVPGSRDVSVYPLDEGYKARFRERYDRWKNSPESQNKIHGTILSELPWMTKSQIAELAYFNVHTVEQLAEMTDANAMNFMGNFKLRERAKAFLAAAAGEAPATALQQALEQRDLTIQTLTAKVDSLVSEVQELRKTPNKR